MTIRESIPKEEIIRAYMDETNEQHEEDVIIEDIKEEKEKEAKKQKKNQKWILHKKNQKEEPKNEIPVVPSIVNKDNETVTTKLSLPLVIITCCYIISYMSLLMHFPLHVTGLHKSRKNGQFTRSLVSRPSEFVAPFTIPKTSSNKI